MKGGTCVDLHTHRNLRVEFTQQIYYESHILNQMR